MKTRVIQITFTTPDNYTIEEPNWTIEDLFKSYSYDNRDLGIKVTNFDVIK